MIPALSAALAGVVVGSGASVAALRWRNRRPRMERYRCLVERGIDKFSVIDASGTVVYVSPGAERVYGVPAEELLGPFRLDDLVHPDDRAAVVDAMARVRRVPDEPVRIDTRVRHHDGTWRAVSSTYVNRLDDPAVRGIVCSEVDITEVHDEREALAREARFNALALEMVTDASSLGMRALLAQVGELMGQLAEVFEADVAWIEVAGPGSGGRRLGCTTDGALDVRVGADDLVDVDPRTEAVRLGPGEQPTCVAATGASYSVVAPVSDAGVGLGSVVFARRGRGPFDAVAVRHATTLANLAGQRLGRARAESDRAVADQRAQLLATYVREAVFTIDMRGRLTWASPATTRAAGFSAQVLSTSNLTDFVHADDLGLVIEQAAAVVRGGVATAIPARLLGVDGQPRWAEIDIDVYRRGDDGLVRELVVVVRDVHEHHLRAERLAAAALIDPLTGAVNRAGLLAELRTLCTAPPLGGFVVAFFDLDGFKRVNDTYGHPAGDEALQVVADRLRRALRPHDIVARFGGDEFVLVLQAIDETEAHKVCARAIASVAEPMVVAAGPVSVSASVGVVNARPGLEPVQLIALADAAMYEAKRAGKNRMVIAGDGFEHGNGSVA